MTARVWPTDRRGVKSRRNQLLDLEGADRLPGRHVRGLLPGLEGLERRGRDLDPDHRRPHA